MPRAMSRRSRAMPRTAAGASCLPAMTTSPPSNGLPAAHERDRSTARRRPQPRPNRQRRAACPATAPALAGRAGGAGVAGGRLHAVGDPGPDPAGAAGDVLRPGRQPDHPRAAAHPHPALPRRTGGPVQRPGIGRPARTAADPAGRRMDPRGPARTAQPGAQAAEAGQADAGGEQGRREHRPRGRRREHFAAGAGGQDRGQRPLPRPHHHPDADHVDPCRRAADVLLHGLRAGPAATRDRAVAGPAEEEGHGRNPADHRDRSQPLRADHQRDQCRGRPGVRRLPVPRAGPAAGPGAAVGHAGGDPQLRALCRAR